MKFSAPTLLLLFTLSLSFITALEPSYESVSFSSDYFVLMEKDIIYSEQIDLTSSGNIENYTNFELQLTGDWKSGIVNVYIDGIDCSPNGWITPSADGYKLRFDCTDAVNQLEVKNDVTLTYLSTKDADNVYGTISTTYLNDGEPTMEVHGTEYTAGQNATTFLQLRDANGNSVNNASCNLDIYHPDKTKWQDNVPMDFLENGLYYYDTVTPAQNGIYMIAVYCFYETSEQIYELPSTLSYDGILKDGSTGTIAEVEFSDGVFLRTDNGFYQQFNFIGNGIGNINTTALTDLKIIWIGQNEKFSQLQIYNFNTASWQSVGSTFIESKNHDGDPKNTHGVSKDITSGFSNYIGGTGSNEVRVRINMSEDKKILTDDIEIRFQTLGASVGDLRGSGEIHVSPTVWREEYDDDRTITNLTIAPNSTFNTTEVIEGVWAYNGTVNPNLLSQIVTAVWNYTSTINSVILDAFGLNVWLQPQRNLTYYEDTTNYTLAAENVWAENNSKYTYGIIIP